MAMVPLSQEELVRRMMENKISQPKPEPTEEVATKKKAVTKKETEETQKTEKVEYILTKEQVIERIEEKIAQYYSEVATRGLRRTELQDLRFLENILEEIKSGSSVGKRWLVFYTKKFEGTDVRKKPEVS